MNISARRNTLHIVFLYINKLDAVVKVLSDRALAVKINNGVNPILPSSPVYGFSFGWHTYHPA